MGKIAAHIFVLDCVSLRDGPQKSQLLRVELDDYVLLALFPAAGATDLLSEYILFLCLIIHDELDGSLGCFRQALNLR